MKSLRSAKLEFSNTYMQQGMQDKELKGSIDPQPFIVNPCFQADSTFS